ncbi:hypothetical protein CR513_28107, partial [Mucuna pruriens]
MVGNATKVAFVLLITLVVIIPYLKTDIGEFDNFLKKPKPRKPPCLNVVISEFDNFLKAQAKEAYTNSFDTYISTLEDVTKELNLHHNYKEEGMTGLIFVSNSSDMEYGFNCNGMFRGCATEEDFTKRDDYRVCAWWNPKIFNRLPDLPQDVPLDTFYVEPDKYLVS